MTYYHIIIHPFLFVLKKIFSSVDETLGFSLSKLILSGPESELKLTKNTQPAIMTIGVSIFTVLNEHFNLNLNNSKFYFDHSYFTKVKEREIQHGETKYINNFKSLFEKENIFGCQPHLEKSQKFGIQMLQNFCKL